MDPNASSGAGGAATLGPGTSSGDRVDEGAGGSPPVSEVVPDDIPLDESNAEANAGATQGSGDGAAGSSSSTQVGGGAAGAGGSSSAAPESRNCSVAVSVTTTAPGGRYRPRNVGAIWIADASGVFLRSLEVWGNRRLSHVVAWNAATRAAGLPGNTVDAVTSATLSTHRAHDVTWNCRDAGDEVVPDGTYQVHFEVTDSNSAGPHHFETFVKGPGAASVQSSAPSFDGIVVTYNP